MKVLILSKDLRYEGGVVNYVSMIMSSVPDGLCLEQFVIGGRYKERAGKLRKYIQPFLDALSLVKKVRHGDYACVHINPSFVADAMLRDGLFIIALRAIGYKNIVVFIHGWSKDLEKIVNQRKIFRYLIRKVYGGASIILVLSRKFAKVLENIGIGKGRISVATTMFDGSLFHESRGREKTDRDQKVILFMARFVPEKGVYQLLEAFKRLIDDGRNIRLILAGDGPERANIEDWVRQHGVKHYVDLVGYLRGAEKADVMLTSDVFVLPTTHGEGQPVVLMEAMAAGLPIVSSCAGGIPEIMENGVNGILLQHPDTQEVYGALRHYLDNDELRHQVSDTNKVKAWKEYECTTAVAKLADVYRSVHNKSVGAVE